MLASFFFTIKNNLNFHQPLSNPLICVMNRIKSELKNHPGILFTKSEEDYVLFVKKEKILNEEVGLLNCLAGQLSLSNSIVCYSDWKGKESSGLYLWVRKVNLDKTMEALNISLS